MTLTPRTRPRRAGIAVVLAAALLALGTCAILARQVSDHPSITTRGGTR